MKKEVSYKAISLIFSVLVFCFAIAFYVVGWDDPTEPPPSGNVAAPLNTGLVEQRKAGALRLGGLTVDSQTLLATDSGNVGIGAIAPSKGKLEIKVIDGTALYISNPMDVTSNNGAVNIGGGLFFDENEIQSSGNLFINYDNNVDLVLNRGGGNVGVGRANPKAKLHVGGTAGTDGIMFPDGTLQTSAVPVCPQGIALISDGSGWKCDCSLYVNNFKSKSLWTYTPCLKKGEARHYVYKDKSAWVLKEDAGGADVIKISGDQYKKTVECLSGHKLIEPGDLGSCETGEVVFERLSDTKAEYSCTQYKLNNDSTWNYICEKP